MTSPHVLALAGQIAFALDGWEAEPCENGEPGWVELVGPAGDRIQLRIGPHRVSARGLHDQDTGPTHRWEVTGVRLQSIEFSAAKPPGRMAGELRRRLLPQVAKNNQLMDAAARRYRAARAADDLLFARIQALFPTLTWRDGGRRRDEAAAHSHAGQVSIAFRLDRYEHDRYNSLTVDCLSRAELLDLLRAAAATRGRTARLRDRRGAHPRRRRRSRTRGYAR